MRWIRWTTPTISWSSAAADRAPTQAGCNGRPTAGHPSLNATGILAPARTLAPPVFRRCHSRGTPKRSTNAICIAASISRGDVKRRSVLQNATTPSQACILHSATVQPPKEPKAALAAP
jgi:hypothetical protein